MYPLEVMFYMERPEVCDLRLSFVSGNSDVRRQELRAPPEDAEPQALPEFCSTETLCLSRTNLNCVSERVLKNSTLKYLYLEGNQIADIPDSLFISLPNLLWLDLRNNQIVSLPAKIGLHRALKTLLLEGNPISELPPELGNVITLRGLNLRYCPITFPPRDIVNQGLQSILRYLRSAMTKRPVSVRKTPPPELPVIEKLQLSELMGSGVEEQDESLDEDELHRFRELRHEMILLDKAELDSAAPANRTALLPIPKRKKATTKAGIIPELPLFGSQQLRKKELREKQALLEQRKKSQEALHKWHAQVKTTQEKKICKHKQREHERQRKREEAETDVKPVVEDGRDTPQSRAAALSVTARSACELERQIRALVEKMHERRRNPRGTATEQMAVAERDVEQMRKLQAQLQARKRYRRGGDKNYSNTSKGDTWQSFLHN